MDETTAELFDRQIRLIGKPSQDRLIESKICFIEVNSLSTEMIKSLLLSGVGEITLVDNKTLNIEDQKKYCSFYLTHEDIGKNISDVVVRNMESINHCTQFDLIKKDPTDFFHHFKKKILQYDVVIFSQLFSGKYSEFINYLYDNNVKVVCATSNGKFCLYEVYAKYICVKEVCSKYKKFDYCLMNPFDELKKYVESYFLGEDTERFQDIPFPIIVSHILTSCWEQKKFGNDKTNQEIVEELCTVLKSKFQNFSHFENYGEARHYIRTCLPFFVKTKFDYQKFEEYMPLLDKKLFAVLTSINEFILKHERHPLSDANLPDMACGSENYLKLKTVYSEKWDKDIKEIVSSLPSHFVSNSGIHQFVAQICKNLLDIEVFSTPTPFKKKEKISEKKFAEETEIIEFYNNLLNTRNNSSNACGFETDELFEVFSTTFIANVAAFEVVKLCTQKYMPIRSKSLFDVSNGTSLIV